MRKICLLAFSLLIFLLSLSFISSKIYASQEISYELAYPGLLPDSPLYFLRIIRDKTVGFLISDPLKKAEFDLLQADKRLNAGIYLLNKNKTSLALSTVSKAENYFGESLDQIREAKMEGRNIDDMNGKLRNALKKHKQELGFIIQKVEKNFRASFEKEQKRLINFEERLNH